MILALISKGQPRSMAVACNRWGFMRPSLANISERGSPLLVLGVLFDSAWYLVGVLTSHYMVTPLKLFYTYIYFRKCLLGVGFHMGFSKGLQCWAFHIPSSTCPSDPIPFNPSCSTAPLLHIIILCPTGLFDF